MPADVLAKGQALLCQAVPLSNLVLEVAEAPPTFAPRLSKTLIRVMRLAAPDVMIVELKMPISTPVTFRAGQYIDLILPDGRRRSYSLANAPSPEGDGDLEIHIRRIPGGHFTDHVFNTMKPRELYEIEGPLGTFFLRDDSDAPIIFVAGGTGFAPIGAIIATELKRETGHPMTLYWGCRRPEDIYMMDLPAAWAKAHERFRFVPVLSEPAPGDDWNGRVGLVHQAVMTDLPDLSAYQVYACGAPAMVDAARADFSAQCKLPATQFFADAFLTEADLMHNSN